MKNSIDLCLSCSKRLFLCLCLFWGCFSRSARGEVQQRIISLAPATTEWLHVFGLENQIVGVTEQCDFPHTASAKPKVGSFMRTSLERIYALKATDVVTVDGLPEVMRRGLMSAGIRIHVFKPQRLVDFPSEIFALSGQFRATARGAVWRDKFLSEIQRLQEKRPGLKNIPHNVAFFISVDPVYLVGRRTWLSDLFALKGYTNGFAYEQENNPFPRVSLESLAKLDVREWIGFAQQQSDLNVMNNRLLELQKKLGKGSAIKVSMYSADQFLRPGPRLLDALRELGEPGK